MRSLKHLTYAEREAVLAPGHTATLSPPGRVPLTGASESRRRLLQRTALQRLALLHSPLPASDVAPGVVRRSSDVDEPEEEAGWGSEGEYPELAEPGPEIAELETGPAAEVLGMLGDLNDYLGLGFDIAELASAPLLESAASPPVQALSR